MSKPNERLWAGLGKVALVVGLVLSLLKLGSYWNPDGPRISARCQVVDIPARSREILPELGEGNLKSWSLVQERLSWLSQPSRCLRCRVSNLGSRPAEELVLDLPFTPTSVQVQGEWLEQDSLDDDSVPLGSVRPGKEITVIMWGMTWDISPMTDDYAISFREGVGNLSLAEEAYGFLGGVIWYINRTPPAFYWVLLAGFGFALLVCGRGLYNLGVAHEKERIRANGGEDQEAAAEEPSTKHDPVSESE